MWNERISLIKVNGREQYPGDGIVRGERQGDVGNWRKMYPLKCDDIAVERGFSVFLTLLHRKSAASLDRIPCIRDVWHRDFAAAVAGR